MNKLETLRKLFKEKIERLKAIRDLNPDALTKEIRTERGSLLAETEQLSEDLDAEKRMISSDDRLNDNTDPNPGTGFLTEGDESSGGENSGNNLIFQSADGRSHRAMPVNQRFSNQQSQGMGFDNIGPGSLGKILRAKILGDPMLLNDAERRAMGEGIGSSSGYFVPSLVSGYVIDLARNASCCMKAGAWTLPMDGPEVTLVKVLTDPTAYWRAEHSAISESDGSFAPIKLKAVVLGTLIRVSQALLEDAPSAGATIEKMLSSALGLELDRVCLLGDGVNSPRGLFNCTDINSYSMGANGAAPTNYDPFSYATQYVLEDNGLPTSAIMAPRTFGTLDRLKAATTNQPLDSPQSYKDLKKFYTNQIPVDQTQGTSDAASCAFVGDFKNVVVGMRKSLTIDISQSAGTDTFAKVETLIRAYMRVDVAVLRENHFTKIIGITE